MRIVMKKCCKNCQFFCWYFVDEKALYGADGICSSFLGPSEVDSHNNCFDWTMTGTTPVNRCGNCHDIIAGERPESGTYFCNNCIELLT